MKSPFKIRHRIALIIISIIVFVSCQKEIIKDETGNVVFSFDNTNSSELKSVFTHSPDSVIAMVVSIMDMFNNIVYECEVLKLYKFNGEYFSKPLTLKPGNYQLSTFLLIDKFDSVLFATPISGSKYAYLVNKPLKINFIISNDLTTEVTPEVISTEKVKPKDFGYASFSFKHIKTLDLLICTFDAAGGFGILTKSYLTICHSGRTVFKDSLLAATNNVKLPEIMGNYELLITKQGYYKYKAILPHDSIIAHSHLHNRPLIIVLYKIPDGLIFWNRLGSIEEIANSEVGPCIQLASYIYPDWYEAKIIPGIFDNGLFINHDTNEGWSNDGANFFAIDNYQMGLSPVKGTIEFWFKFKYDCSEFNHAYFLRTADSLVGHFTDSKTQTNTYMELCWNGWDYGSYGKRYVFAVGNSENRLDVVNLFTPDYSAAPNGILEFYTNTSTHFAFVWDRNGIDGSSETMRIYVNGHCKATRSGIWSVNGGMCRYLYLGTIPCYNNWDQDYNAVKGVMDNIKIWNYAKTNFSDRYSEMSL
jgi:hypothetical protein